MSTVSNPYSFNITKNSSFNSATSIQPSNVAAVTMIYDTDSGNDYVEDWDYGADIGGFIEVAYNLASLTYNKNNGTGSMVPDSINGITIYYITISSGSYSAYYSDYANVELGASSYSYKKSS